MKTIHLYTVLLVLFILAACQKGKDLFDKTPDERKLEKMGEYQKLLTEAKDGWMMYIFAGETGAVQQFLCKFLPTGRVLTQDLTLHGKAQWKESSYMISSTQGISLTFNSGSLLGKYSSVEPLEYGSYFSLTNQDLIDFEFQFDKILGDTIFLMGVYSRSPALMIKGTSESIRQNFEEYYQFRKKLFSSNGEFGSPIQYYMPTKDREYASRFGFGIPDVINRYFFSLGGKKYITFINPVKSTIQIAEDLGEGRFEKMHHSGYYYDPKPQDTGFLLATPIQLEEGPVIFRFGNFKKLASTNNTSVIRTDASMDYDAWGIRKGYVEVRESVDSIVSSLTFNYSLPSKMSGSANYSLTSYFSGYEEFKIDLGDGQVIILPATPSITYFTRGGSFFYLNPMQNLF